jgi:hypothetical protein
VDAQVYIVTEITKDNIGYLPYVRVVTWSHGLAVNPLAFDRLRFRQKLIDRFEEGIREDWLKQSGVGTRRNLSDIVSILFRPILNWQTGNKQAFNSWLRLN